MTTTPIMTLGEARRREEAAKKRGERYQVSDEVRAQRAALLDAREAAMAEQQAEAEVQQRARPDAVRAVLQHASLDELGEFQRVAGQLDGRRLVDIVADVIRQRQRTAYVPPSQKAQEALPARKVSSSGRTR